MMNHLERADVLLAQLQILLAGGRLEAAASLAAEIRQQLRAEDDAPPALEALDEDDRSAVLGPLSDLLRRQRALAHDIQDRQGTVDTAPTGRLQGAVRQVGRQLTRFAQAREDQATLVMEAARRLGALRGAAERLDLGASREAAASLRELVLRPGPPEGTGAPDLQAAVAALDALEAELADDTALAVLGRLAARQRSLRAHLEPLLEEDEAASAVHPPVRRAVESMDAALAALVAGDLGAAAIHARAAGESLTGTLRTVDDALSTDTLKAVAPPAFLARFDGRQLPEWDLPPALGLHLHDRVQRAGPEGELRRELAALVRRLIEPHARDVTVSINRMGPQDGLRRRVDVGVLLAAGGGRSIRYRVRLSFQSDHGALVPSRWGASGELPTFGGAARVLFTTDLAECEVTVLRLLDRGSGPAPAYVDTDMDPSLRALLHKRLPADYAAGALGPSPVQAEVLAFLQSLLQTAGESPLSEAQLKTLGVPWYDVADLVDRLRPVQERLQYQLLEPRSEDGFLGLLWAGELGHCFCLLSHGRDGRTPLLWLRRSLLDFIAWAARSGSLGVEASPKDLLVALQLNLGLKAAFYDALVSDVPRAAVRGAAQALEGAWLRSRGLSPTLLRDLFCRVETAYRGDVSARAEPDPLAGWRRAAENLLDARAGEQLLKGSRFPASVLFSSLRGVLAHDLRRQGLVAASRSAEALGAFDDAAVLFANLAVEPTTGDGVLLVGDSKLGKSSITARLVAGDGQHPGWRFGASDRVLLLLPPRVEDAAPPAVLAIASPAHMSFGNFAQEHWYRDEHGREIRPPDHAPSRDLVPVRLVVFLRRDGAELRTSTLSGLALGELVRDFQTRFGFPASRRFWKGLFAASAVLDAPLSYRGADMFLQVAGQVRQALAASPGTLGGAEPRSESTVVERVWYDVEVEPLQVQVWRVDRDGIDVRWSLRPDGSVTLRPEHLGQDIEASRPGGFDLRRLAVRVPLERDRIEQVFGQPMFRLSPSRWMPLTRPYFAVESGQPFFLVPELPGSVVARVRAALERAGERFAGWDRRG